MDAQKALKKTFSAALTGLKQEQKRIEINIKSVENLLKDIRPTKFLKAGALKKLESKVKKALRPAKK